MLRRKVKLIAIFLLLICFIIIPANQTQAAIPLAIPAVGGLVITALLALGFSVQHPTAARAMVSDCWNFLSDGVRYLFNMQAGKTSVLLDAQAERELKDYIKNTMQYEDGREIEFDTGETAFELIAKIGTNPDWRVPAQYRYSDLRFQKLNFTRAADTIRLSINGYQGGQHKQTLNFQTRIELGEDLRNDLIMTAPGSQSYIVSTKYGTYPVFDVTWDIERISPYEFRMYLVVDGERVHYLEYTGNPEYDYRNYSVFNYGTTNLYDLGTQFGVIGTYEFNRNHIVYNQDIVYNEYYTVAGKELALDGIDEVADLTDYDQLTEKTFDDVIQQDLPTTPTEELGWLGSVANILSNIYSKVAGIPGTLANIADAVRSLPQTLADSMVGELGEITFEPLKNVFGQVTNVFPFSLPWDLRRLAGALEVPVSSWNDIAEIDLKFPNGNGGTIDFQINLPDSLSGFIPYIRWMFLIIFDIGMIFAIRRLIGGAI